MNIHPTSGGDAPLYTPEKPSFLNVFTTQSSGPANWEDFEVWRRTLIVSKLVKVSNRLSNELVQSYGWPTVSFATPEPTPATKPLYALAFSGELMSLVVGPVEACCWPAVLRVADMNSIYVQGAPDQGCIMLKRSIINDTPERR